LQESLPEYGGHQFNDLRVFGFIDGKIDATTIPGTGPVIDEPQAPCQPDAAVLQEAVYSGYLKKHGLKVLTLVLPNGIVTYVYGPISAQENDISALNLSGLNGHLIALQPNIEHEWAFGLESLYYSVYTDSIFPFHECVTHQHEPPVCGVLLEREVVENHTMSAMWNSVEWPYGGVTILFHIMQSKYYCK